MKQLIVLFVLLPLAGCDDWFSRRVDVASTAGASFSVGSSSSAALVEAVRKYAAELNLTCTESSQLPFECFRQPIRVRAFLTNNGASVCFWATGAQFERSKFEKRMARLDAVLASAFGTESVHGKAEPCLDAPHAA